MLSLRPYQSLALAEVRAEFARKRRRVLLVSPTGSGKTVAFAAIVKGATDRGQQTLILAHRAELIDQISAALDQFGIKHSFIAAGYPYQQWAPVHVASVQTVVRRLGKIAYPTFIVCDEAHHILAATYRQILAAFPHAKLLGVTATPRRASGDGLGEVFESMVLGPSVAELISAGYLSPFKCYGPPTINTAGLHVRAGEFIQSEVAAVVDKPSVMGDAIAHYRKLSDGKPAVVFCYSIEHSQATAAAFREAGYKFEHIDGGFDREARRQIITDFRSGRVTGLCSVDLVGEGFDVPGIHCGILLRPTASEGLYLQQVGRVLRPAGGKDCAVVMDHAGNAARFGLPDEERGWSLDGATKRAKSAKPKLSVRICPQCWAAQSSQRQTCVECDAQFPLKPREVAEVAGELVEIQRRQARREQGRAQTLEELIAQHIARGGNPYTARARAQHILNGRRKKNHDTQETTQQTEPRPTATAGGVF